MRLPSVARVPHATHWNAIPCYPVGRGRRIIPDRDYAPRIKEVD
jgi:hypothetical protein